ncbi:MAG: DUF3472 domain-containing protein [Prevotellaceae bacterium]|nr:DUF3472 domain-containing protein [Prevotellaceae bacterium]
MKKFTNFFITMSVIVAGMFSCNNLTAQTYQTKADTAWGNWCYKFQNGDFYSKQETKGVITSLSTPSSGLSLVYYLRIPETGARADFVYTPKYARMPKVSLTVTRVSTGDTLCTAETQNTTLALTGKEIKADLLPHTNFPADEYYRFELKCDNWSYITNVKYFIFQRTSELPILQHPQGGYGQHLFTWASTIPDAPTGQAYDWAYQEVLVPRAYQHPADYYCTIATLQCYMGIQTLGRVGDGFNRTVLFSCWDSGNTDEDPNLPHYLRAKVYDYNHLGVSGHGGGEGSSGTIQLNNETTWWRSDEWVQFLVNARPESATEIEKNINSGEYEAHDVENTLLTVWYKMASDSAWTYLATIREACKNEMMGSWYSFIENFGGSEGHQPHKVYYRHGYMRSAASGKWYNRNKVGFNHYGDRTTRTDRYSGTTNLYENAFQMTYGGWGLATDSGNVAGLPKTDIAVDTINLDPLNKRIDKAAQLWRHFSLNEEFNRNSEEYPYSNWTVVSATGSGGSSLLNDNKYSYWESTSAGGHEIVFKSNSGEVPINSFRIHHPDGYNSRVRYVDAYTSGDGENWTLGAKDVFINNEDDNEVTLPVTIRGQYFKLFFHEQINSHASARLKISTLAFRGDYDLDKIKAVAKEIIDNENALQFYKTEDIARLKYIYDNGSCTNVDLLSAEIRRIYRDCFPLMYGRASATSYITATKAYMMQNCAGYGFLCADIQNGLVAKGASAATALDYAKGNASATEPLNTWQIVRSDKFENVYVYNIGLKKYLNPESQNWFSDEPYPFAVGISGKGCSLRSAKQGAAEFNSYLNLNTSLANPFSWGTLNDNSRFYLLEDYYMRPDNAEALAIVEKSFTNERLEAAKTRFVSLLDVPEGRIGSIESETKTRLETLYNGGDVKSENIMEFIEGVENIKLLELDTKNVYKFTSASATSATNLGMTSTGLTATASSTIKPGMVWKVNYSGEGVIVSSQGKSLSMLPKNTTGSPKGGPIPTTTPDNAAKYYLTEKSPGIFNFSDHSYPTYAVGISGSSAASVAAGNAEALWTIDKVNEYTVRTNNVGVAQLYVDFDLIVPEGREVYVAYRVTDDGVVKLASVKDTIPALTPILIKGNPSENIVFGIVSNNQQTYVGKNIFSGCLFKPSTLKKNEYYVLTTSNGEAKMKRALLSNIVSDNEIYIAKSAEMPDLQYYTFDFDNLIDGVEDISAMVSSDNEKVYDLQGRSVKTPENGLYIINNKVVKK